MKLAGVGHLIELGQTSSTQDVAREIAQTAFIDGTLIWSKSQSFGRGRMDRHWQSEIGGLYISWLFRPQFKPGALAEFSLACGSAVANCLRDLAHIETKVKPPNDVLALDKNARWRKISGILCEAAGDSTSLHWLIVGVGINVNNHPKLKRAVSVKDISGKTVNLSQLLNALMTHLYQVRSTSDFVLLKP